MRSFIILLNKFLYAIGKCINKGSSVPGKVSLKLDKNILSKIKLPENVIFITGSNGKTSTTEMICNIFQANGYDVGCNKEGANQIEGVTTTILNSCDVTGKVKKDILILEIDERYLRIISKYIKPTCLVVTNLYRDQLTRNGHPEFIYNKINEGINNSTHLILNADDPLSSLYGYKRDNVTYFGINHIDGDLHENNSVYNDCKYCPNCGEPLKYEYYHFSHVGKYRCENCGHERKNPDYSITDLNLKSGEMIINGSQKLCMNFKSFYNAYNIIAAYSVAKKLKIEDDKIINVLNDYIIKNDRVQEFNYGGKNITLLTSKHENSISYDQSLKYIIQNDEPCSVIVLIDSISRKYYTSEISWIWDIDFELLNHHCINKIYLAGKYSHDLMIRFKYSHIQSGKVVLAEDLDKLMEFIKKSNDEKFYVVTCFSDRMKFIKRTGK